MRYFVIHQPKEGGQDEYEVESKEKALQDVFLHISNGDYANYEERYSSIDEMYQVLAEAY